jgi:thiol-disulfide isomerase/thioredoxin
VISPKRSSFIAMVATLGFGLVLVSRGQVTPKAVPASQPIAGILLGDDGQPLAKTTVICIAQGCSEDVSDGTVTVDGDARKATTDENGRFAFTPSTRPAGSIIVVTQLGRAWAAASDVNPDRPLHLRPFSYVEGTVFIRNQVACGAAVKSWCIPTDGGAAEEGQNGSFAWTVTADAQGRFRVPVLGGETSEIGRVQPIGPGGDLPRIVEVLVPPSSTIRQDVGGGGRLVTFSVHPPTGYTFQTANVQAVPEVKKIQFPQPDWPAESVHWDKARQDAFYANWAASPSAREALAKAHAAFRERDAKFYYGKCGGDGIVRLEDVLPGKYFLVIRATGLGADGQKRILTLENPSDIDLPPAPGKEDQAQSWGMVQLSLLQRLYLGDVAPQFDFAGLNSGRVRLADYKGKYVLVHFWATWCGPCIAATPDLRAIEQRFASDPRFVCIHIAEDETVEAAQRYVTAENLGGVECWCGPAGSCEAARAYGAEAIPTMVLVGPNGKVVLVTHHSSELSEGIAKALGGN